MEVEMSYEGDPDLVCYLLSGAQDHVYEQQRDQDFLRKVK